MDSLPIELVELISEKSGNPYIQINLLQVNKLFREKLRLYDYDKMEKLDRVNLSNRILFAHFGSDILGGYPKIKLKTSLN